MGAPPRSFRRSPRRSVTDPFRPDRSPAEPMTALEAVSAVVARLAAGEPLAVVVPVVLGLVAEALEARELSVWTADEAQGLSLAWRVGEPETTARWLSSALETPTVRRASLRLERIVTGGRQLGVLAAVPSRPFSAADEVVLATLAQLLGPQLAHAEQQHQLEVEVAARTRQIEEERRFTQRIIDALPVGLYVVDRAYRVQAWNRKRETGMQGVSREQALGRPIFEILHRQPADSLRRDFDELFETGASQTLEVESTATGTSRTYRISKVPMRVDDGAVTHIVTIGEDVTEWKEAQERVAHAEKLAAIGQLAAGVMHEINNPLATIAACVESLGARLDDLQDDGVALPAGTLDFLRYIDDEVQRCSRIVSGLLDFSRPTPAVKAPTDLNGVVDRTLALLQHHGRFKRLTVVPDLEQGLAPLGAASEEQLVQVLMALLLNAMDAMGGQGTVTVRTRRGAPGSGQLLLEVADEGAGIPRSELAKIFEPFYTTKATGEGTGLGLAICYGIVQEHGGRIEVDSVVGEGSTFRVVLPVAR
jgi:two-component system, NtrC family, sensor kinase